MGSKIAKMNREKTEKARRVWGIKLGSGGRCVPFCDQRNIVGVGWKNVQQRIVATPDWDVIWKHLKKVYPTIEDKLISNWTGSLFRFGTQCQKGDYVIYYDPDRKLVHISRVTSGPKYRSVELDAKDTVGEELDIWHYREVEKVIAPIPILDFYGAMKGKLLGPRITFWEMAETSEIVECLAAGIAPNFSLASDPQIRAAYNSLRDLVIQRAEALNERDWEWLVADFARAQGARVEDKKVGGSQAVSDVEARFDLGVFGESVWRVQVKRLQQKQVDTNEIDYLAKHGGDAQLCFVSVFGFTAAARSRAEEEGIRLMEGGDFVQFLLSGKLRESVANKMRLPLSEMQLA